MDDDAELFEGKYQIAELLGEGGMGVVHAAVNVYSGARVAIKRIPKEVAERGLVDRLLAESRVLALLDHGNIVRLLDCGPTPGGGLYIAMELVAGDSLRALIRAAKKRGKLLDLDLVVPIIAQSAEAMEFAHSKGVYHRDLKPENIMVRFGGQVKVLDFGLAKAPSIGPVPGIHPTNPARVVGTPRYMAPEQVRGKAIDARTDIYGLGVVLYEAVSGRTPYDKHEDAGTTITELMGHHVFADPTPVREHVPTCPNRLWEIIIRCLAKDPGDRYPDMRSLAKALRAALEEMVAPSVAVARPAPSVNGTPAAQEGPREVRETEPVAMPFPTGAALPFTPPPPAPEPPAARTTRDTEPMPPSFTPVPSLPFVSAPEPPRLGKGHTQPLLPSAATLLARQGAALPEHAEPCLSRPALPPPPSVPQPTAAAPPTTPGANGRELAPVPSLSFVGASEPGAALPAHPTPPPSSGVPRSPAPPPPTTPGANRRARDSGDAGARSGPGFAFEPTSPGSHERQQVTPSRAQVVPRTEKPQRMKLSPILVLPVAFLLAVAILFLVNKPREGRDAGRLASAPSVGASSTIAPSLCAASASAPLELTTLSASSTDTTEPAPVASAAPPSSAAPMPRGTTAVGAVVSKKRRNVPKFIGDDPVEPGPFMVRKKQEQKKEEPKKQEPKASRLMFGVDQ